MDNEKNQRIVNRLNYDIWLMKTALPNLDDPEAVLYFERTIPQLEAILNGANPSYPKDPKYYEKGRDVEDIMKERGITEEYIQNMTNTINTNVKNGSNLIDELKKIK